MTMSESVLKLNEKKLKWLDKMQLLLLTNRDIMNRMDMLQASLRNKALLHCNKMLSFLNNVS
jgi:hypothetical protein